MTPTLAPNARNHLPLLPPRLLAVQLRRFDGRRVVLEVQGKALQTKQLKIRKILACAPQ